MEAWNFVSENREFASDESVARDKSGLSGWEMKTPTSFGNSFQSQGFGEMGFGEPISKSWDVSSSVTVAKSNSEVVANRLYTPISSSAVSVHSSTQDFSLIDLNLGRLSDHRDTVNFRSSKVANIGSSVESSSASSKRTRASLSSQGAFCQVHGCRKDLSSCKDYHKRHRVCEIHSKTAKVLVNGIEQRFCQQCSRFHLLVEFDNGKRSCRKRLAGHNERRRKPPSGRLAGRLLHSYYDSMGSRPRGITLATSSFTSQNPTEHMYPYRYNSKHDESGTISHPQSGITISNGYHNPQSMFSHNLTKNVAHFYANEVSSSSGRRDLRENINENFIISPTEGALSLLSSQSRITSNHSSDIFIPNFSLEEGNNNLGHFMILGDNNSTNYENGIFQGSDYINNSKDRVSCDEGAGTIDLFQLSSQLHRVDHERQYVKLNQDDDAIP